MSRTCARSACHYPSAHAALLVLASAVLLAGRAVADWPSDPTANLPVCTAANNQVNHDIATDGAGGAIIVWSDLRDGVASDLYAQRVLAGGIVDSSWPANGRAVCTAAGTQFNAKLVPDGMGGAIVLWGDFRSGGGGDIYAQRLSANGQIDPAWPADGLPVCTADSTQTVFVACPDGAGGAYVAWWDWRSGLDRDIYAQHVLANGAVDAMWPFNGLAVCTAPGDQLSPGIIPDGSGGAVVVWSDSRGGVADIYAQHVISTGMADPTWPFWGSPICVQSGAQQLPDIATDGEGGAFIVWQDSRAGSTTDIYSAHVLASGVLDPAWPAGGQPLCVATGAQTVPRITSAGPGNAIVCWMDNRSGSSLDIYAQRAAGPTGSWPTDGVALSTTGGDQRNPRIVPDGTGGAIVAWQDKRTDLGDIYAQHVLADGHIDSSWPSMGKALCTAALTQQEARPLADGSGGAIIAWYDDRGGLYNDVYAQRVQANGQLGGTVVSVPALATTAFSLDPIRPNPSRDGVISLGLSLAGESRVIITLLDLAGRRVVSRDLGTLARGYHAVSFGAPARVPSGVYFVRVEAGGDWRAARVAILD